MAIKTKEHRAFTLLHTGIIIIWTLLATLIFGPIAIIASLFSKTGNSVHRVGRGWAKTILWVSGIRVTVSGTIHSDLQRSYIFMCNHQSNFDIPVLYSALPNQFRWLAKIELFRIPVFGLAMQRAGYISIDRSNRKLAFQSLERAAQLIRSGTSVMIFPEGTRSLDGRLRPFKKGGFVMAADAGVPIVPIVIEGTFEIMPKSRWVIERGRVHLKILEPISTEPYTRNTKDELMACVRESMISASSAGTQEAKHA